MWFNGVETCTHIRIKINCIKFELLPLITANYYEVQIGFECLSIPVRSGVAEDNNFLAEEGFPLPSCATCVVSCRPSTI